MPADTEWKNGTFSITVRIPFVRVAVFIYAPFVYAHSAAGRPDMLSAVPVTLREETLCAFVCRFISAYVIIAQYPHCEHIFLLFRGIGEPAMEYCNRGLFPCVFCNKPETVQKE